MIIKTNNTFHLQGRNISYIMAVNSAGDLLHVYYGKKLRVREYSDIPKFSGGYIQNSEDGWILELHQQEYPS